MSENNLPVELQDGFPEEGINFKQFSFLISKKISNHPMCRKYSFNDCLEKRIPKDVLQLLEGEYSQRLKDIKDLLKAFDVEKYFRQNPTTGKAYCLSKPEVIYYYKIFQRMTEHHDIWQKIRTVDNKTYQGYVCVNEIGDLIKPNYVTAGFKKLLKDNGMREIRFHDLRHSCASLLLSNGVPMKQIQEWLGHSDFSTTANIYAHLDYSSKLNSADAMLNGLGLG